jgi:hypothetical protein
MERLDTLRLPNGELDKELIAFRNRERSMAYFYFPNRFATPFDLLAEVLKAISIGVSALREYVRERQAERVAIEAKREEYVNAEVAKFLGARAKKAKAKKTASSRVSFSKAS